MLLLIQRRRKMRARVSRLDNSRLISNWLTGSFFLAPSSIQNLSVLVRPFPPPSLNNHPLLFFSIRSDLNLVPQQSDGFDISACGQKGRSARCDWRDSTLSIIYSDHAVAER